MMFEVDRFFQEFFSDRCCEVIAIQRKLPPSGIGAAAYGRAQSVKALLLKEEYSQESGCRNCKFIWLIPGDFPPPSPGDRITRNGEYHELTKVEICRDPDGNIVASKCSVS